MCRHGEATPGIRLVARSLPAMLDDLELATKALQAMETMQAHYQRDMEDEWVETLRDLIKDKANRRASMGDKGYEAYLGMVRWSAQRALLGRSGVSIPTLSWMYVRPKGIAVGVDKTVWAGLLNRSPLRLQFVELPVASGESAAFKQRVSATIKAFKQRWDWAINPLVIAVVLEVVIRPNPDTPPNVLHDLDNIVRDYLIPKVVPEFGTVSDHRWTIDFAELRSRDPKLADAWGPNPTPPRTAEDLDAAPIIEDWFLGCRMEPALVGTVIGHPTLLESPATTSGIYLLALELGYARTLSRFYKLGPPAR